MVLMHRDQYLEILVSTLSSDVPLSLDIFPSISSLLPIPSSVPEAEDTEGEKSKSDPVDLPVFLIPDDLEDADTVKVVIPPATSAGLRGDEGVGYEGVRLYLKLFDDEVSLLPTFL